METGSGDRLPSIDTRRPRMHDTDAIIEVSGCHLLYLSTNLPIIMLMFNITLHPCRRTYDASGKQILCHSSMDGDDMAEQQDNDPARKDHGGADEAVGLQQDDTDHLDSFSPAYNGQNMEFESRKAQLKNNVSNDEIVREDVLHFPSEVTVHSHPDREIGIPHEERYMNISIPIPDGVVLFPVSSTITFFTDSGSSISLPTIGKVEY